MVCKRRLTLVLVLVLAVGAPGGASGLTPSAAGLRQPAAAPAGPILVQRITPTFRAAAKPPTPPRAGALTPKFGAAQRPRLPPAMASKIQGQLRGGAGAAARQRIDRIGEGLRQHTQPRLGLGSGPRMPGEIGRTVKIQTGRQALDRLDRIVKGTTAPTATPKPPALSVKPQDLLRELRRPESRLAPHFGRATGEP